MTIEMGSIFNRQLFAVSGRTPPSASEAAKGFTRIFAAKLTAAMRHSLAPEEGGSLGLGGGPADIYGTFLDQAVSAVIAGSGAMKPLNQMLEKVLEGSASTAKANSNTSKAKSADSKRAHQTGDGHNGNIAFFSRVAAARYGVPSVVGTNYAATSQMVSSGVKVSANEAKADSRGPLLLPPPPSGKYFLPPPQTAD